MSRLSRFLYLAFFGAVALMQSGPCASAQTQATTNHGQAASTTTPKDGTTDGLTILSDTQGVDFGPYVRDVLNRIKNNWQPLLPEETRPPLSEEGEAFIRFTILPDGKIGSMKLDSSTHNIKIDHACWLAIASEKQFPPLPSEFHGPNLELRIHFLVNKI